MVIALCVNAKDLQKIVPFMVQSAPTELEDGQTEDYLSVDPSAFTYMLINAVKEMNATMESMDLQMDVLESRIANSELEITRLRKENELLKLNKQN
jgi:hypothetical protein